MLLQVLNPRGFEFIRKRRAFDGAREYARHNEGQERVRNGIALSSLDRVEHSGMEAGGLHRESRRNQTGNTAPGSRKAEIRVSCRR